MYLRIARIWQNPKGKQPIFPCFEGMDASQAISRFENCRDALLADPLVIAQMHLDVIEGWLSLFGRVNHSLEFVG
jgi:hypothetical protein